MSDFDDQSAAILVEFLQILPTYTRLDGYRSVEAIDVGDLPFVAVFNPEGSAAEIPDGFRQSARETTWSVLMVRDVGEGTEMRADVESAKTEIDGSIDLLGKVDRVLVTEWAVSEARDDRTVGALAVTCRQVTP